MIHRYAFCYLAQIHDVVISYLAVCLGTLPELLGDTRQRASGMFETPALPGQRLLLSS
jgi:hypothetical protein